MKRNIYIFITLFLIFLSLRISSIEKNKIKAFEFSIGGGFENSLNFKHQNQKVEINFDKSNISFEDEDQINNIISLGSHLFIPASFVFYIKRNFGIGFKIQNGLLFISPNYIFSNFDHMNYAFYFGAGTINEILIVNKIGNYFSNALIFEYGLSSLASIYASQGIIEFLLGPKTMVGFEKRFNNKFAFLIGGNISTLFKTYPSSLTFRQSFLDYIRGRSSDKETIYTNHFSVHLIIGVEIRLKVNFIKEF